MKKTVILGVAFVLALSLSAFAQSDTSQDKDSQTQSQSSDRHQKGRMSHEGMMDSQQMVDHLNQQLNLTDDQKTQIKTILDNQHQQMQALRSNSSASDRKTEMKQLRENTHSQIRAVLKPDQQAKFDQMMKDHDGMGMQHHGGMDKDRDKDQSETPR